MTVIDLLSNLRTRGVVFTVDGDRLSCNAPKGVITPEIRQELADQKTEILRLLGESSQLRDSRLQQDVSEFPLSRSQRRLWFLDQVDPGNPVYNIAIALRLSGLLDRDALEQSLRQLVIRHETLRTHFLERDGAPYAVVDDAQSWTMEYRDLSSTNPSSQEESLTRLMNAESQRPFELQKGPLFRVSLYKKQDREHVMLLNMHHIISDGWSIGILAEELGCAYEAEVRGEPFPLPPLPMQFRDFVHWEAEEEKRSNADDIAYWRKQLGGDLPQLALPADRPRPAVQTFRGGRITLDLDRDLEERLKALARDRNATFFMALAAAFTVVLRHYSRQEDVLIGTPTAGRMMSGFERLIGFFVNNLVLRFDLGGDPSFVELLDRVRTVALEAFEHQSTPFDQLVEMLQAERRLDRSPVFQVLFSLQNTSMPRMQLGEIEMKPIGIERFSARFDLAVDVYPFEDHLRLDFEYNTDIFEQAFIRQLLMHYVRILELACEDRNRPISRLCPLNEAERRQILYDWNSTAPLELPHSSLPSWFRAQVQQSPEATALEMGDRALSYRQLNLESDRVAWHLRSRGIGRGHIVAVYMRRSPEMVIGLLGILKAGAAYLPLDPALPRQRLDFMLGDAGVALILSERELSDQLQGTKTPLLPFEEIAGVTPAGALDDVAGADLAYVIYTSGSTGQPKGTEIHHAALINLLGSMLREPGLGPTDILVAITTISFDIAGLEIFGPLVSGAKLVLASREQTLDPELLARLLETSRATVMQATPSTWRMLIESGWTGSSALRMWCGGEALSSDLAENLITRGRELWNLYGPTETTIWSAAHRVARGESPILIGGPIANTQMYILDDNLEPVPIGVTGELYIAGQGVACGYRGRPDLAASRFLEDPFDVTRTRRMYRTGDLARYRRDGQIQLFGRTDDQIKLRGHRIELGEIESAIERHPSVRQAAVRLQGESTGKQLVGFVCFRNGSSEPQHLRSWLQNVLPDYMVPAILVPVDELPLTPNGKVDRNRLSLPETYSRESGFASIPPRNRTEQNLTELWSRLLDIEKPGIRENFFDLGGNSFLLVQLHAQLKREFNANVAVIELFRYPTIEKLAWFLDRRSTAVPLAAGANPS